MSDDQTADGGVSQNELRLALQLLQQRFDDELESEEIISSFNGARGLETAELYAITIIDRVEQAGALRAACEDVADSVGRVDYDEAVWAIRAVAQQWQHVADVLEPTDRTAIRVRIAVEQLRDELAREDLDLEMLPDLVTIVRTDADLLDLALEWKSAADAGDEVSFWSNHEERVRRLFTMNRFFREDLMARGELGLDDEVLPPDNEGLV